MTAKVSLDKAGRVVLPKSVRDQMRLAPGDTLALDSEGEQITLRPVRPQATLKKELGVWVYQGRLAHDSLVAWLEGERQKRLGELAG